MIADIGGSLAFIVGVAVQVYPKIKNVMQKKKREFLLACVGPMLLALLYAGYLYLKGEITKEELTLANFLLMYGVLLGFFVYFLFKRELLPSINEKIVIIYTLLAGYIVYKLAPITLIPQQVLIGVGIIALLLIGVLLRKWILPTALKLLTYIWFLCILMGIAILHGAEFINIVMGNVPDVSLTVIEYGISGMFFMYIMTNILSIFLFIPTRDNKIKEIREHARLLIEKYTDEQVTMKQILGIMLVMGTLIGINAYIQIVSETILIDVLIVGVPFFISHQQTRGKK